MAVSILPPAPAPDDYGSGSEDEEVDSEGDVEMQEGAPPPSKKARLAGRKMVTPGENITDDPQWMRCSYPPIYCIIRPLIESQRARHIHYTTKQQYRCDSRRHHPTDQQASLGPTHTRTLYARDRRPSRWAHRRGANQEMES